MSISVMTWVWGHSSAEGVDLLVLLAIADNAQDDGGGAWPSVKTLSGKARVSERTVQRCVRSLVELGELTVDPGAGKNGVNVYRVTMNKGRQRVTPVRLSPVTPEVERGDTRVTGGVTTVSPKPSLNHPEPSMSETKLIGGAEETLRTADPHRCPKHQKLKLGEDPPCRNCRRTREAAEKAAQVAAAERKHTSAAHALAQAHCGRCNGTGKVEDPHTRLPTSERCNHKQRASA